MSTELLILSLVLALQTIVIIVVAIALLKTTKRVAGTMKHVQTSTEQLNETVQVIRPRLVEIVGGVNDFIKTCQPVGEQIVDISMNIKDIVESTKETTRDVSDLIKDTSFSARQQISKIDNVLTSTVKKVETVTNSITYNLLNPLSEISAFLVGIRAGMRYLKGERPSKYARDDHSKEDMVL